MVSRGERPPKPVFAQVVGLTPAIWELTMKCWQKKAAKRPGTSEVLAHLEGMSSGEFTDDQKQIGKVVLASPSLLERAKGFLNRHAFLPHRGGRQTQR